MADQLLPCYSRSPALSNATNSSIQKTPPGMVGNPRPLSGINDAEPPEIDLNDCTSLSSMQGSPPSLLDETTFLSVENEPPGTDLDACAQGPALYKDSESSSIETNPSWLSRTPSQSPVAVLDGGAEICPSRPSRASNSSIETNPLSLADTPRLLLNDGVPKGDLRGSSAVLTDHPDDRADRSSDDLEHFPNFSEHVATDDAEGHQKSDRRDSAIAPPPDSSNTLPTHLASGGMSPGGSTSLHSASNQNLYSDRRDPDSQDSGSGAQLHGTYPQPATRGNHSSSATRHAEALSRELGKYRCFQRDQHDKVWRHVMSNRVLPKSRATYLRVQAWILAWLFMCYSRPEDGKYSQDNDYDRISVVGSILRKGHKLLRTEEEDGDLNKRVEILKVQDPKLREAVATSVSEHGEWLQKMTWNGSSIRGRPEFYELYRDIETAQAPYYLKYISRMLVVDILDARANLGTTDKFLAVIFEKAKKTQRLNRRESQKNENPELGTYTPSQMSPAELS
ncbi:hypothetical protein BP6252_06397 [Coleophoma cylindrospora]|uniref:Uncharacterized protein n=1 Tax=Coleophoma cylindrospora TaxID=1849047 RepID=A0A3D8RMG6_9HELO|nr:hypothetical protein BP6252_06397 [Coleophoma cylindrospora]